MSNIQRIFDMMCLIKKKDLIKILDGSNFMPVSVFCKITVIVNIIVTIGNCSL
jgi:hypothetical protein